MKEKILSYFLIITIFISGIVSLVFGIYDIIVLKQLKENGKQITAIIEDIHMHTPIIDGQVEKTEYITKVSYEVDGQVYTKSFTYYDDYLKIGDKVEIYYNTKNPSECKNSFSSFNGILFIILGSILGGIGGISIITIIKEEIEEKNIKKGKKIYANFKKIEFDPKTIDEKEQFCYIICEIEDKKTEKVHTFRSDEILGNPENIIKEKNIKSFPVYIKNNDYKKYYMDIDSIK